MPHAYTVRGRWPFSKDMLRRDQSRPATESDREMIEHLSGEHASSRADIAEPMEIELVSDVPNFRPNTARWESFGWSVPSDHEARRLRESLRHAADEAAIRERALAKLTEEEREVLGFGGRGL